MRRLGDTIRLSASDLANHLGCEHLTQLDRLAARRELEPPRWADPGLDALQERGLEHEAAYLDHLRARGLEVEVVAAKEGQSAFEATREALVRGADVLVQTVLESGRWFGRADVLLRVEVPSALGAYSYEIVDTKLARETKASTILQLCLYSELLAELQGRWPEWMYVVTPGTDFEPERYRVDNYSAFYRLVRGRLLASVDAASETVAEPVSQCDVCRWWPRCDSEWREQDHLSLVAGISRLHRRELQARDVSTMAELARVPLPLSWRPERGSVTSMERVREQARVQVQGRESGEPLFELLERVPEQGLYRLPEPCPGDVFFDIEGDPYAGIGGLEYLLGYAVESNGEVEYEARWALGAADERRQFEAFIDWLMVRWEQHPGMHVYHYAPYEPGAMKRLMGRYATREDEVDRLLRAKVFVDLYAVARHAVRASVEKYSIKDLEVFYGYEREVELRDASASLRQFERALEMGVVTDAPEEVRRAVERYNYDDCASTLHLRNWLEGLRAGLVAHGEVIARPVVEEGLPADELSERLERVMAVANQLALDVPEDVEERTTEQHARWLLANMLDWHRREDKSTWWEFFRLAGLSDEERFDDVSALAGLEFVGAVGGTASCPIHRYRFPQQDVFLKEECRLLLDSETDVGSLHGIDPVGCFVDIKKKKATSDLHPPSIFGHTYIGKKVLAEALLRLGEWVVANGMDADGSHRAARDLLLRNPPRRTVSGPLVGAAEDALSAVQRLGCELNRGLLAIQGPPGSGKTYKGARMIVELVRAGRRVGVTAVSHKVIQNLLEGVVAAARDAGVSLRCGHKLSAKSDVASAVEEYTDNKKIIRDLQEGDLQVVGGTGWLWARSDCFEVVDTLVVDEAGQMSLTDVCAVAQAARNVVLLGDPQQLEQPIQGSHPPGTEVSALHQMLGGQQTIAPEQGLFLPTTRRLHPDICSYTSEIFYEGRLQSEPECAMQRLAGSRLIEGTGLWVSPVEHYGNQNASVEEAERVADLVAQLTAAGSVWFDSSGVSRPVGIGDILVVAPYNAHVTEIGKLVPGARVGTVDKFQGQQAPVVIYSMATSAPEDAPRGMEFLYSLNRLNVATSRARCACILVANPALFEPDCRTPRQMQLANAFCRYLELATVVPVLLG